MRIKDGWMYPDGPIQRFRANNAKQGHSTDWGKPRLFARFTILLSDVSAPG